MCSRARPLPASLRVVDARDAYLAENGFTVEEYDAEWTKASAFGVPFVVPNTRAHRRAIMMHDLHHVATGFGTDFAGEGQVSAYEIGAGLRGLDPYVRSIVWLGLCAGLVSAPLRTLAAFRAGRRRGCLFGDDRPYEDLLALDVSELRALLDLPEHGLETAPRGLHARAPRDA